ncbi:hypothetical protein KJ853_02470 [Patescibacteria group bacterium]|nr:hypothetical protein [Patescibacteria group bacterium]
MPRQINVIKNKFEAMAGLNNLAEEFAKIGVKMQTPKISGEKLREKLIEKWNLNNIQEQWERQRLSKKS